jgi:DNA-binding GntR family transcriptional regulator
MTADEQQALLAAHQSCQAALEAQEPDAYYYRNEVFHEAIYTGSHNQFLIEQTRALYRRLRPYRRLQLRVRNRLSNSYHEHEGVVEAILAGDGELAAQLLREHVMIQGQRFSDLMASLPQLTRDAA